MHNARVVAAGSPLVPLKQIPRVHLVRHVRELVAPAVGDDHVAVGLEGLQVAGHLGAEELRHVQRGLVNHHGHALGLHVLHDALDGARAEVVGVGLLVAYADVYLGVFDCSCPIGRAFFGQQRRLTESDIVGKKRCAAEISRYIRFTSSIPLGSIVDNGRGLTRGILMQSALREKG